MNLPRKTWLMALPLTALLFACTEQTTSKTTTDGNTTTTVSETTTAPDTTAAASAVQEAGDTASAAAASAGQAVDDAATGAGAALGLNAPKAPYADGSLTGAGASFPYPLYSKMFDEYAKETGVSVNYQSVGSGTGQKQIIAQTVDFGASDNAMDDEKLASAPGKIAHIPMALGAVTATYNVPGLAEGTELKMTGPVLADIYLGKIKTWNDPALTKINEGVQLPALPITVARRSDSSGTTAVFTDYLSKVSPEFKEKVGSANSVNWTVGSAAKGNDGVAGLVQNTPGSIGYIEEAYAKQNNLPMMAMENAAGEFVKPSLEGVTAAAAASELPEDMRGSVTNAEGAGAYPMASYTYLLVYPEQNYAGRDKAQGERLQHLLQWMLTSGQGYHEGLSYAKLPDAVRDRALETVNGMTFDGQPMNPMQ
ncbi:phosphate ABC transporter, periplasmic phosphate-binding protein [Deinococcus proteolyticus MRP]|uniref:Phosphate-binding protein n=1 Tax=Deinococcus proteolyticus (strain ATCC 35074 / DSM 20540 / JCM 6276 / NBRC 101906 / NCIMB 13154 / VKM Ac-1939 / CCM 2703 / MRP) TaxID=693977 RepID=F0RNE4_DEIPM|nr:phosphate ABC transporter substrate-binding protein PstS [Deinococcus proteolyticus]ADY25246.1 phosphate ABC transporter, periplasmic phosphate-binding protein [Deinococcus proteolyticus MRP]